MARAEPPGALRSRAARGPVAFRAFLLLALLAPAAGAMAAITATDPPRFRVSLVTIGPGDVYWARFGHNAILVEDRTTGRSLTYNYGLFDLAEDDFLVRFARGRMRYLLAAFDAEADLARFRAEGRSLLVQELALDADQRRDLVRFLEWNRQPAHRAYRYDYFRDNCSTRVRDALDQVLGGRLRAHFAARPAGATFRDHTNRLAAPEPWLYLLTDLALGPLTDRPISRWDAFFLPAELAAGVAALEVPGPDGALRPLVAATQDRSAPDASREPTRRPMLGAVFGLAGAALGGALLLARRRSWPRRLWWLASGAIGGVLLALWLFTDHEAAWANQNLLLFSPIGLSLALVPERSRVARLLAGFLAASLLLGTVAALAPIGQRNLDWWLLTLPAQLAALAGLLRFSRPAWAAGVAGEASRAP